MAMTTHQTRWPMALVAGAAGLAVGVLATTWILRNGSDHESTGADTPQVAERPRGFTGRHVEMPQTAVQRAARTRAPAAHEWPSADAPATEVIRRLEPLAAAGSPQAACRVAAELARCKKVYSDLEMAELLTGPGPQRNKRNARIASELLASAEASTTRCEGLRPSDFLRIYRHQTVAFDSGRLDMQRWLVQSPGLHRLDFLADLDGWRGYQRRAHVYAANALRARQLPDLDLLVQMHVPSGYSTVPGTARIHDDATFLALMDVARQHGSNVVDAFSEPERALRDAMAPDLRERYARRRAEIGRPWRAAPASDWAPSTGRTPDAAQCAFGAIPVTR